MVQPPALFISAICGFVFLCARAWCNPGDRVCEITKSGFPSRVRVMQLLKFNSSTGADGFPSCVWYCLILGLNQIASGAFWAHNAKRASNASWAHNALVVKIPKPFETPPACCTSFNGTHKAEHLHRSNVFPMCSRTRKKACFYLEKKKIKLCVPCVPDVFHVFHPLIYKGFRRFGAYKKCI